ncbi:MAG TPA: alpha/beta hydrolase [Myxococcales bacterium]|jgi:acetyl esterase
MAIDEETRAYLAKAAQSRGGRPLHELTPGEARAARTFLQELVDKGPEMARTEEVTIGAFKSRLFVPQGEPRGMLVWFHGGGWVLGSLEESDTLGRMLAKELSMQVLVAGYRLAPEHRFPTAVEDAWAAVEWAAPRASGPLVVGGDSAGGNLAAVTSLRARDRQGPRIALQILVYPVVDARLDRPSYLDKENALALTQEGMKWFWNHYAPDPAQRLLPEASPLRAGDFSRLPPAVVLTAEHDVLRDEGEAYAQALVGAGVPVAFKRFERQVHTFFTLVNALPASMDGLRFVARAASALLAN